MLQLFAGHGSGDGDAGWLCLDQLGNRLRRLRHEARSATMRPVPWLEGTAMVLCDVLDHHTIEPYRIRPRAMLKKQIARLERLGFEAKMATELEFFPVREKL